MHPCVTKGGAWRSHSINDARCAISKQSTINWPRNSGMHEQTNERTNERTNKRTNRHFEDLVSTEVENSIKLAIAKLILLLVHLPRQYLKRRNGIITVIFSH